MVKSEREYKDIVTEIDYFLERLNNEGWLKDDYVKQRALTLSKMKELIKRTDLSIAERDAASDKSSDFMTDITDRIKRLRASSSIKGMEIVPYKSPGGSIVPAKGSRGEIVKAEKEETKEESKRYKEYAKALAQGFGKLKEHKSAIGWLIALIIIVPIIFIVLVAVFGFFQDTPFGQLIMSTLQAYIPVNQIKSQVGNQLCMTKCYLTGFTSVASWTAAGGLDKYCQANCQTTATAEQLGCTNCYSLTPSLEEPTPIPLGTDTIKLVVDAPEGKKYSWGAGGTNVIVPIPPALNLNISIVSNDFTATINEKNLCLPSSSPNECNFLQTGQPGSSVGPNDVPIQLSADFSVPCKSSAQYDAWFSYGYNVTGVSFVKFKDKSYTGTLISTPQPTSSPGPLKFNAQPYTDIYNTNTPQVRITFSLINQGGSSSTIRVNSITLDQIAPVGYGNLTLASDGCIEATANEIGAGNGAYQITGTPIVYPGDENAVNFHCTFNLPSDLPLTALKQSAYYTILATAQYTYKYKITGDTVFPDPRYSCRVTAGNWKMAGCFDAQGNPTSASCQNQDLNGNTWSTYNYDDSQWSKISLPDSWSCSSSSSTTNPSCSRFYRLDNIVYDSSRQHVWFNITTSSSSNTITCSYTADNGGSATIPNDATICKGTSFTYCNDLKNNLQTSSRSGTLKHYYSIACSDTATNTGNFGVAPDSQ